MKLLLLNSTDMEKCVPYKVCCLPACLACVCVCVCVCVLSIRQSSILNIEKEEGGIGTIQCNLVENEGKAQIIATVIFFYECLNHFSWDCR